MADGILSTFVSKLSSLVVQEAVFLRGVEDQLILLRDELQWIRSFLKEAQHKRRGSDLVEVWVTQTIDLAYDAEDVVDAYILHVELQRRRNFIEKAMQFGKKAKTLHQLGNQIEQINTRAKRISACRLTYDLGDSKSPEDSVSEMTEYMAYRRRGMLMVDEAAFVGFKVERTQLAAQMIDGEAFTSRKVISILGMGGLGKTTLARVIFNDMSNHFKARIWITVSQKYEARDILLTALKQLIGNSGDSLKTEELYTKMDDKQIEEELYKLLEGERYLLVIDDMWKVEDWERSSLAFPNNNKGSRIILTTRNKDVALHAATSRDHLLELRLLDEDERWELFCKKVFSMPANMCPTQLVEVGKDIVEKCGGLPLAIVVIGGFLMGKERTVTAWSKVCDSAKWQLSQVSNLCRETLLLSYLNLPHYLKSCFLYLGLFPEDYEIEAERLILLWVSEGFVEARGEENMEEVAEDCLEDLIQRSMVQVVEREYFEGPVKSCRIHDLLRDFAISESRKDKFMDFHNSKNNYSVSTHEKLRRFTIHSTASDEHEDQSFHTVTTTNPNLRSLFVFGSYSDSNTKRKPMSCCGTKILRVLNINHVNLGEALPREIGNLFFLKYLRLSSKAITSLPNSVGQLVNLLTLDLQDTSLQTLPRTMWKLKNLRHLYLNRLCTISPHVAELCRLNDFGRNLLSLRAGDDVWKKMSDVLAKVGSLRSLDAFDIRSLGNGFPLSLTDLTLHRHHLQQDPSGLLGSLPKLKSLIVYGHPAYADFKMVFRRQGFSQLEYLELNEIRLTEWRVEEGALPSLRDLMIQDCRDLKKLSEGLKNVTGLQRIRIKNMPQAFYNRVKEIGEDWEIIKHVPHIDIDFYIEVRALYWELKAELALQFRGCQSV